ncbi:hypothetical protein OQA88_685 [Cercophora sp. LCS_1]
MAKRSRVDCGGGRCGQPDCESCYPAEYGLEPIVKRQPQSQSARAVAPDVQQYARPVYQPAHQPAHQPAQQHNQQPARQPVQRPPSESFYQQPSHHPATQQPTYQQPRQQQPAATQQPVQRPVYHQPVYQHPTPQQQHHEQQRGPQEYQQQYPPQQEHPEPQYVQHYSWQQDPQPRHPERQYPQEYSQQHSQQPQYMRQHCPQQHGPGLQPVYHPYYQQVVYHQPVAPSSGPVYYQPSAGEPSHHHQLPPIPSDDSYWSSWSAMAARMTDSLRGAPPGPPMPAPVPASHCQIMIQASRPLDHHDAEEEDDELYDDDDDDDPTEALEVEERDTEDEDEEEDYHGLPNDGQGAGQVSTAVLDFDHYSKSAWRTLNTSHYTRLSSSKQYDASFDAFEEILECITSIQRQTMGNTKSSYGTKLSALETLRKIAKTVLLGDDTLGHEVRKQFQWESALADAMLEITTSMTPEERLRAGANDDGKGALVDKLEWVHAEAGAYCIEGLEVGKVVALLSPPVGA